MVNNSETIDTNALLFQCFGKVNWISSPTGNKTDFGWSSWCHGALYFFSKLTKKKAFTGTVADKRLCSSL